jgi:hypothetical protein
VKRDIPSLPRSLRDYGYQTHALHVDSLSYFNYRQAYNHLGFQNVETLHDEVGIPIAVSGRVATDAALVDLIIDRSRDSGPQFIFAFPNATHGRWRYEGYEASDLKLIHLSGIEGADEAQRWARAVHEADRDLKRLIDHFAERPEPTLILVLGDHWPALDSAVFDALGVGLTDSTLGPEDWIRRHTVEAVVWSNYPTPKKDFELSMNLVGDLVLETAGYRPTGFLGLHRSVRSILPVLSTVMKSDTGDLATSADALPPRARRLRDDYRLLQYDALFGERFLMRAMHPTAR